MNQFFIGWKRKTGSGFQSWKTFFLVTAGACVIVDGFVAYSVRCKYLNFAIAPAVVSKVEFQNIMTAVYTVGDQRHEIRQNVGPKHLSSVGDKVFVRYEVVRPANSSFTSFSQPWMEIVATSIWLSFFIAFFAFFAFRLASSQATVESIHDAPNPSKT